MTSLDNTRHVKDTERGEIRLRVKKHFLFLGISILISGEVIGSEKNQEKLQLTRNCSECSLNKCRFIWGRFRNRVYERNN